MKYRDTFFRFYFSDKERLLSLCNALTGEDATDPNEIEITTLDETFFSKRKNDISCLFRNRLLILIEHQTTVNKNMPLRFLLYLVKLLNKIYDKEFSRQLYNRATIKLPRPEFYVFYNGLERAEPFVEMKLSNAFVEWTDSLELKVKFYNINNPHNRTLLKKCLPLEDYCEFVERVKLNKSKGMNDNDAFLEAYRYCAQTRATMKKFLDEHEWELFDMIITEYNEQWAEEANRDYYREKYLAEGIERGIEQGIEQGIERGIEQGIERGIEQGTLRMIKNLLNIQTPIEYIVKASGWSEEEILKFAQDDLSRSLT